MFLLRYSVVAGLVAAGLLSSTALDAPSSWFLMGLTVLFLAVGTYFLISPHPSSGFYPHRLAPIFRTMAPVALALGGAVFTLQFLDDLYRPLGMALTSAGVALVIYSQYLLIFPRGATAGYALLTTNLSIYLGAFLLFVVLQSAGLAPVPGALGLGGLSGLLALALLHEIAEDPRRAGLYAGISGLLLAQVSWVIHFLPLDNVVTSLLLLLSFYLLSGLVHTHLLNRLNRWVALEFVGVTAIGLGLVYGVRSFGG